MPIRRFGDKSGNFRTIHFVAAMACEKIGVE
jgi:hypothetical protein